MEQPHRRVAIALPIFLFASASLAWAQGPALTVEEKRAFLRSAEVVGAEQTSTGATRPWRLTLSDGTLTHDAAFQSVDQYRDRQRLGKTEELNFVDSYRYNIAAYQLAVLVGLGDMVPVTVERKWKGETGAISWWIDDVMFDEATRIEKGQRPDDIAAWVAQMSRMSIFEALVHDTDRNRTNMLYTSDWKLYMVDFSRAFRVWGELPDGLNRIDGQLFRRLRTLTTSEVEQALRPMLTAGEVNGVLTRRDLLVEHFEDLIALRGEEVVIAEPAASTPTLAEPGANDAVPPHASQELGGRLLSALDETPVVLAKSELAWIGIIVPLSTYTGPHAQTATVALDQGHEFGLATELDGLLPLTPDPENPKHYDAATAMPGRQAQVFGFIEKVDGLSVVQVTLCRESP